MYRRNRYYDPAAGQFTYGFANGDPVNYTDPFGLGPCRTFGNCLQGDEGVADVYRAYEQANPIFGRAMATMDDPTASFGRKLAAFVEIGSFGIGGLGSVGSGAGSAKPALSAVKKALQKVHDIVGKLPKGKPGKFGSPQRGTPIKGYRLDPGHPGRPTGDLRLVPTLTGGTTLRGSGVAVASRTQFPLSSRSGSMERFKIEHFRREHPGTAFPWFRPLSTDEATNIKTRIRGLLASDTDDLNLTRLVAAISVPLPGVSAEEPGFCLARQIQLRGVRPEPLVFINWYRYDEIDEMRLDELSKHLAYVWYPKADDIEVFDDSLQWMLTIAHTGEVGFARL
jgi:hypothetical protein